VQKDQQEQEQGLIPNFTRLYNDIQLYRVRNICSIFKILLTLIKW